MKKTHTINGVEWTEDQMRVAIAKACGAEWTSSGWGCRYLKMPDDAGGYGPDESSPLCDDAISGLPDYLNDLNAMHEAENGLTDAQYEIYEVTLFHPNRPRWASFSALQRAIAFIQALELKPE